MNQYTIYCTEEQTKKALKLGAPLQEHPFEASIIKANEKMFSNLICINDRYYCIPTAEQMIGFILETGRGYSCDLTDDIFDLGYKKGCLAFIDFYLK